MMVHVVSRYPFENTVLVVAVIHEETDLPVCITVNGVHLQLAAIQPNMQ